MKLHCVSFLMVILIVISPTMGYDKDVLAGWSAGLNPAKVVYALNVGSRESLTDAYGVTYKPVSNYSLK